MQPITQRFWTERITVDGVDEADWCASLNVSPLVCRLLLLRGVTTLAEANSFLTGTLSTLPDPFLLAGMDSAVTRLVDAIANGEKIAVHGDYDVDGITGTAMLCDGLRQFGAQMEYHIPLRMRDGYGLSESAIRTCADNGVTLLLSVDCGISALSEALLATELGLDLIITDHHQPLASLPQALACINPWQSHCSYPDKKLSGVGVAFMLIIALRSRLRELGQLSTPEPDIRYLLDLVAMGTIADLVPLHGVNRVLVQTGLRLLERELRPGVKALKQVADAKKMSAGVVGYKLAPRLNAAGRLEDASLGVQLLLCDQQVQADALAQQLNAFNSQRQTIERQVLEQALERVTSELSDDQRTIVLADERWHSGVIGIVASRLVERFNRPTVLIALTGGEGKGSARSIRGFHLFQAFQQCSQHFLGFGGHEYAAGLSMHQSAVADFAMAFEQHAQHVLSDDAMVPVRNFDAEVLLQDLDRNLYDEMHTLAPFGAGNPEPLLICSNVRVQNPSIVGEKHIRFIVQQDGYSHPCIAFGLAERFDQLVGCVDILFNLSLNCWRDRETLQLQVKDFRVSQSMY